MFAKSCLRLMTVVSFVCFFSVTAYADCASEIAAFEKERANEAGVAPQRLEVVDRLIEKAKNLNQRGIEVGCLKVIQKAQNLLHG